MKKIIYALTVATAGLLGSCSSTPDAETVARCNERVEEVKELAKGYNLKNLETELEYTDWCYTDKHGLFKLNKKTLENMHNHCLDLSWIVWNILDIEGDPFKKIIFLKQPFCSRGYNLDEDIKDINRLQYFIDSYGEGEKK